MPSDGLFLVLGSLAQSHFLLVYEPVCPLKKGSANRYFAEGFCLGFSTG